MNTQQAKDAIGYGAIEAITLYRPKDHGTNFWKIWFEGVLMGKRPYLELATGGDDREFQSLDTAFAYVRKLGWQQMVQIDG